MLYSEGLVYLPVERVYGCIVGPMGTYYSTISYSKDGLDYEVLMENDEFVMVNEFIEYDEESEDSDYEDE